MKALCKQNQCGRQEGGSVHRGLLVEDGDEEHQEEDDEEPGVNSFRQKRETGDLPL